MARILTGIQSSGKQHLGNILGAIKPAIELAKDPKNEALFFIADMHSLTSLKDGEQIREALERLKNSSMEIGKSIYANTSSDNTEEPAQEAQQESTEETKSEEGEKKEEDKEKK